MTRVVVSGLVGLAALAMAMALTSAPAAAETVRLDGVSVRVSDQTAQLLTVNHTRGYHARVVWWTREGAVWTEQRRVRDGRIGYGGLVRGRDRVQGTGTTPLGTYSLLSAFGTGSAQAQWRLDYRKIQRGDYWVQDNRSAFYNRYRNRAQGGFRWWLPSSRTNASERLSDFPRQYEVAIVTSFNRRQVRHRGSGIFFHVNGPGATGGCVSAPRPFVKRLMARLDPAQHPVIAIGR
jgi:L,D-peptidoglycan transpeptidase YkuD (ErfK/YbiS/YcfS/YnhG family)